MNAESCCAVESPIATDRSTGGRLHTALLRIVDLVALWQDRATQRRDLAALDHRMLRDIGVDRATAVEEATKPFWRR